MLLSETWRSELVFRKNEPAKFGMLVRDGNSGIKHGIDGGYLRSVGSLIAKARSIMTD